ncbi:hypothetical protein V7127_23165 [Bacillus sp. JJ1773]|uniref:hypothetical protein n=1 Tax=Bacillus sp. JJ1773 TaxID=3122965 RepID=UPI0030005EE1
MSRYLFNDVNIQKEQIDRTLWPTVHEDSLDSKKRIVFCKRKEAIDMYLDGEKTVKEIYDTCGINHTDLYRLLTRCISKDEKNRVYGYKALIPNYRIKTYKRLSNINGYDEDQDTEKKLTGAFTKLLELYPNIKTKIHNLVLKKRKNKPSQPILRGKDIHDEFIKICKEEGLMPEKEHYPFNTNDHGKRSLYRYIEKLKADNPNLAVKNNGPDAEMLFQNTGSGNRNSIPVRPFERVEFDGHKIDVTIAFKYTTIEGDEVIDVINRIWLLMVVDVATRVILGFNLVLNKEYSAADVMVCLRNAIMPWSAKKVTIPGLRIADGGGFASEVIPETTHAVWDEILFDNAMANIASSVDKKLKTLVGCHVNTGPVSTPIARPVVEKLFHILEETGFHRITSTVGSNPRDPRRQNPEEKAIKYEISIEEIEQLTEVLIANRNGYPQKGLNGLTPLETMRQRINRGMPFRTLEEKHRDGYDFVTIEDKRHIRGKLHTGRRPYITYYNVEYRNEVLSEMFDFIGEEITLVINLEDLRFIKAYLPDGTELGLLTAKGKWSLQKHSLKIRIVINKLSRLGILRLSSEDDPIEVFHNHLKDKGKRNRDARSQAAMIERMLNEDLQDSTKITNKVDTEEPEDKNKNVYPIKQLANKKVNKPNQKRERMFFNS